MEVEQYCRYKEIAEMAVSYGGIHICDISKIIRF